MSITRHADRLVAAGTALASARRVRLVSQILLFGAIVFVLLRLRSIWHESNIKATHIAWQYLVGAMGLAFCGITASAFVWLGILHRLGCSARPRLTGIYFQAQLGKYVPGSVWQYASRIALARPHALPLRPVTLSLPVEFLALVYSSAAVSLLLLGWWGFLGILPLWLLALVASRSGVFSRVHRIGSEGVAAAGATAHASFLDIAIWPVWGVSFWLTARAFVHVSAADLPIYVGAFAAAWLIGFIAVYAPGGLGVREAMLVAILHNRIGGADALVVAAASRALLTLVDLAAALAGVLLLRRDRSDNPPALAGGDPA